MVHALKDLQLFRDAEWAARQKAALADTARMAVIRVHNAHLDDAGQVEEALADMFTDWSPNGRRRPALSGRTGQILFVDEGKARSRADFSPV